MMVFKACVETRAAATCWVRCALGGFVSMLHGSENDSNTNARVYRDRYAYFYNI